MVLEDFEAFGDVFASERSRFMGGPCDRATAWYIFCQDVAGWTLFGHGALMIERSGTGETVGQVGINAGPRFPETEIGWMLYDGHEGQGYAAEAATALRRWGYRTRGLSTLVSYIDPENAASIRVAERMGAVRDAAAPVQDPGDLVYRHPAPETVQ